MLFGVALKVYSFVNIFLKTMSSRVTPGALDFLSYTPDPSVLTSIGVLVKGFTDVGRYVWDCRSNSCSGRLTKLLLKKKEKSPSSTPLTPLIVNHANPSKFLYGYEVGVSETKPTEPLLESVSIKSFTESKLGFICYSHNLIFWLFYFIYRYSGTIKVIYWLIYLFIYLLFFVVKFCLFKVICYIFFTPWSFGRSLATSLTASVLRGLLVL